MEEVQIARMRFCWLPTLEKNNHKATYQTLALASCSLVGGEITEVAIESRGRNQILELSYSMSV